jgi:hypothetical protein
MRRAITAVLATAVLEVMPAGALAENPHFVSKGFFKEPICRLSDDGATLTCEGGRIAGVGAKASFVAFEVAAGCGQEPLTLRGAATAVDPKAGNITFGSLSLALSCPAGQAPTWGPTVQFFIVRDGQRTNVGDPVSVIPPRPPPPPPPGS